jgi:putative ABC transport system permease protein
MISPVFHALLSHWWRNRLQLFTLLAGLAMATALWSGVQAVNAEARASYATAAATLDEGQFGRFVHRDGAVIDLAQFVALRRGGWRVSPIIEADIQGVRFIGFEPLTAPEGLGPFAGDLLSQTEDMFGAQDQIFASVETLSGLTDLDQVGKVQVQGIAGGLVYADIAVVQSLTGREGEIDFLVIDHTQPIMQTPLAQIAPELMRQRVQEGADIKALTDSFHLNLTAFGLLAFAVGIFIVNGAIGLAFEQRRAMTRTLRALGVPLRHLLIAIVIELFVLALIAGSVGVVLGYGVASLLLPDVAATLGGLYGADVPGELQLHPMWWLSALCIAVVGTAIAAGGALWQLYRMPLLAGAQPRAQEMAARRRAQVLGFASFALLCLAAVLAMTAQSLIMGFVMLSALLIGAALALPIILSKLLAFCETRARAVTLQWFWADTRQQLPGLSLALMALLLAMAANIGVTTMVSSFRLTFVGFLDQRLTSELYVSTDTAAQAEELQRYAPENGAVVLPIFTETTPVLGQPVEVMGVRDHETFRTNWVFLDAVDDPWTAIAQTPGVLINEQFARRMGLAIGQELEIVGEPFTIAGIYGDYGNPIGQALIGERPFTTLFPDVRARRFGLRLDPADVTRFRAALRNDVGIPDANMINQAGIKDLSLAIFDRTFTVTGALNVLTLAVAGFAMLMSLLTLASMRLPQLAPAWAVGLTRRQLGQYEILRAMVLAVLTVLCAVPLGLALAWVLLEVVNVAAFGWRLPIYLFPLDYLKLALLALCAAALAAAWPARRLARTPPADLLKVFSNER